MSAHLWGIPARVKSGAFLPEGSTEADIEQAAQSAFRDALRCASDGGHEIVWPTARLTVETSYNYEEDRNYTRVMAFAVCAKREVAHAAAQD